jgi:pyruvate dehydrogenase E1 component alpha subunit
MEKDRMIGIYRTMVRIRKFEEKALKLFESNVLRGSVHLYIGQEAIASTVCSRLSKDDYITSTHRGHGHCIAKGAKTDLAMAELMGKVTGYCKGKGGSMHIADVTEGNLGANAIVGAGIPIAAGGGLAVKLRGTKQAVVCFFGDGASNQGAFHEGINLAAVWKLPVVFICENNLYGISVHTRESTSVENIADRAASYNIPGYCIDGNDVFAVDEAVEKALARARAGEGPTLIEAKTYRWMGHWTGDPQVYRTKEEVEEWKKKCPIRRLREYLTGKGILSEKDIEAIEAEAQAEVDAAEKFARESPDPDPARVMEDVFAP